MDISLATGLNWNGLFSLAFGLALALAALYAAVVPQGDWRWWLLAGLLGGLVLGSLQVEDAALRMLLLDAAALAAVGLVWIQPEPEARSAAWLYFGLLLAGMLCLAAGLWLAGVFTGTEPVLPTQARLAVGLIAVGFALKLALVPFYFWMPRLLAAARPMTAALIVSVLGMAEFGELASLRAEAPWVFADFQPVWLALALLSMFGGALLALAQTDLKRMLAFSTIDDLGYLLLGVLAGTSLGLTGAFLGALSHTLFKLLLFGAVGIVEKGEGRPVGMDCTGLAARYPVAGAAFIAGAFGMIGVPPLLGFMGRWRLYLTGLELGGPWLGAAMAAATGLALFYYVRAIHRIWLGRPVLAGQGPQPGLAAWTLAALLVVAVLLGIFPGLLIWGQAL